MASAGAVAADPALAHPHPSRRLRRRCPAALVCTSARRCRDEPRMPSHQASDTGSELRKKLVEMQLFGPLLARRLSSGAL